MKRQKTVPPYIQAKTKTHRAVLPVTMAIVGASMVVMAVMLFSIDKSNKGDAKDHDVENYDIVGNKPFIFAICE
jgi:hypothetical protein